MPFGRLSCLLKSGIIQTFFFLYYQYSWKTHIYNIKWLSISRSYHDLCRKFINSHFALQNIHLTINIYTYIYHYDVDKVVHILTFLQIIHTNADVSCVATIRWWCVFGNVYQFTWMWRQMSRGFDITSNSKFINKAFPV